MALIKLLHSGSLACQTAAARALAPLVVSTSNKGAAMRDGVVPLLVRMLDSGSEGVRVGGALATAGLAANSEDCQVSHHQSPICPCSAWVVWRWSVEQLEWYGNGVWNNSEAARQHSKACVYAAVGVKAFSPAGHSPCACSCDCAD